MLLCHVIRDDRAHPELGVILDDAIALVTNHDDSDSPVDLFTTPLEALRTWCERAVSDGERIPRSVAELAPAPARHIWAAGVTYKRSQQARMEESSQKDAYDKVYDAPRPEIFLKSTGPAASDGEMITIRSDSSWNVPEPELTLVINNRKEIVAYTIGNDVSSREIEGENPLYLPQAKIWNSSASIGRIFRLHSDDIDDRNLEVEISIDRGGDTVFHGETNTREMKRSFDELVDWLHRGTDFPQGVYLMTGTGIVPPDDFTLEAGDEVTITIPQVGTLTNEVAVLDVETNSLRI